MLLEVRREEGGEGGARWEVGIGEVGASAGPAEGAGGAVVRDGSLLGGIESAEPVAVFGRWVAYLRRVSPPGPPPHSEVPHAAAAAIAIVVLLLPWRFALRFFLSQPVGDW